MQDFGRELEVKLQSAAFEDIIENCFNIGMYNDKMAVVGHLAHILCSTHILEKCVKST